MSKSDKTQAFYDRKEWWDHVYTCFIYPNFQLCPHKGNYPRSKYKYYSYPQCGYKKPLKYKRAKIKNYYNSKKYKNNPSKRDIASLRWYWD